MNASTTVLFAVSDAVVGTIACVFVAACVVLTIVFRKRRTTVWNRFARQHGFTVGSNGQGLRIDGTFRGHDVTLEISPDSSDTGVLGVEEVVMSIGLDASRYSTGLRIESTVGVIGDLNEALNKRQITTGNDAFDRDLLVTGLSPEAASQWLTEHRQLAFLNLVTRHSSKRLAFDADGLSLQTRTAISRLSVLDDMLESLIETAQSIDIATGTAPGPVEQACTIINTKELR